MFPRSLTIAALLVLAAFGALAQDPQGSVSADALAVCSEQAPAAFVNWARKASFPLATAEGTADSRDLEFLRKSIGRARIVAIGDAARRVQEFYSFRSRLVKFLVEQMGFTAFAAETGFSEAIPVNDYLLGRKPEPSRWQDWFTFGFGDEAEFQSLLRWMRHYNDDPGHVRKLHFYGIDVMVPYSNPRTALDAAFTYLDRVDPAFASTPIRNELQTQVQKFLDSGGSRANMEKSFRKYAMLSAEERNAYTAGLADLLARLDSHRTEYVTNSSQEAYDWARHAAVAARQLDGTYRADLAAAKPGERNAIIPDYIWEARDAAMFENLEWALQQEGRDGRVAIWAHNLHLFKGSVPSERHDEQGPRLGILLDKAFGADYFSIGTDFYEGKPGWQPARGPAPCGSVEGELARAGSPAFVLDLRSARRDGGSIEWLNQSRVMQADIPAADYKTIPALAWDALVFFRRIEPVRLAAQN